MKITMAHGSGGNATKELITELFQKNFSNQILNQMEDAAVLPGAPKFALTTDSFVITPLFFPGGDIGKLAVCGTVNDLAMVGATPRYLTSSFIMEEGLDFADLEKIVESMKKAAAEAGVDIVAGDTKVVEGKGGVYINTAGVGFLTLENSISAQNAAPGDAVILSGTLGNHHACILARRMKIENSIASDCAPLNQIVANLLKGGVKVKSMRDVTRGGLATVLNEIAESAGVTINIGEEKIPVDQEVQSFCGILGLDPLYMANEGKMICIVPKEDVQKTLEIMHQSKYGEKAALIGHVADHDGKKVVLTTKLGGQRLVDILYGEGLPRIC
ncbi:hydrogenase expression/formation protein HypE [Bacillota bacterium LX-D]|nr:hydrogenase expression/formation protein HypE [Bacillota bacterium LX-D]